METVFDPLRRIAVPLTPEEKVRQWFIGVLRDVCMVPLSLMNSETSFKMGQKQFRADILIWDKSATPLAVVECKRPQVQLNHDVLDQAIRYNMAINLKWIFLTNGNTLVVMHKIDNNFQQVNDLPTYEQMLSE